MPIRVEQSIKRKRPLLLEFCNMGCINSKSSPFKDSRESPRRMLSRKGSMERVHRLDSSRKEEVTRSKHRLDSGEVKVKLIDKKAYGFTQFYDDRIEKKKVERCEEVVTSFPTLSRVPKAIEGEQVAAGWPSWLAAVAGEAIKGWTPRHANTFEKLEKIGQGTYSSVYKARDIIHNKLVALKRVRFDNHDPESIKFMAREIVILRRLDHPNVIKLEGLITSRTSCTLYLVFEYMEHDLVGIASLPGVKFSEPQVKCYMHQLLSGLDHCHSHGVLHRDIKGSNLLIDSNGILKIADFGLASFFDPHDTTPLTSRVITLWYRPPELLLGQFHLCLAIVQRVFLLFLTFFFGQFFTTKPYACEPSSLPKYPPSKEIDARLRDEAARSRRVVGHGGERTDIEKRLSKQYHGIPHPTSNVPFAASMQERKHHSTSKSRSEIFTSRKEDPTSGFLIHPTEQNVKDVNKDFAEHHQKKLSQSGPLGHGGGWAKSGKKEDDPRIASSRTNLSTLSTLVATRTFSSEDQQERIGHSQAAIHKTGRYGGSFNESESITKLDRKHNVQRIADSPPTRGGRTSIKEPNMVRGPKGNRIYVSGPLLVPSQNVDQMLKEHDHRIQEFTRRARHGKKKHGKVHTQGFQQAMK
ncbi:probable serine/threonine-protein kinase At1g09600 [Carica papaya]|uniref:probable serine/threonine-protein kinase At1g09600 n=1 Tax=Carica papaya TaxID=3649 RepID=UPI000B8CE037|nr:probable serine/threonine-protein kinase At1g09600 [Carica papaya]